MRRDLVFLGAVAAVLLVWLGFQAGRTPGSTAPLSLEDLLAGAPEEFLRITGPEPLEFPADHAAHPGYRSEWWYFTGNLEDVAGDPLGWQFTLFRFGLGTDASAVDSAFAADAVWMAHLAVSDGRAEQFYTRERFARDALDLAGAGPERWWLRDWEVLAINGGWRVRARAPGFGVDLHLEPRKPVVLQGDAGYSRKGSESGNASRYYSITRLETAGTVHVAGRDLQVTGLSWLDQEWGSSQLGAGVAGWDWFALQLDDGRDLMVYRLRTRQGTASPFSAGVVVDPEGRKSSLMAEDFDASPKRFWTDRDGVSWPVAWQVKVPAAGLDLEVEALFDAQRWYARVDYWEGAVTVRDAAGGELLGRGYLELSGYAEAAGPPRR